MKYIYKITNKINNKAYIGQTTRDINIRFREHLNTKNDAPLHRAMQKYGKEAFSIELLEEVPDDVSLDDREIYWIKHYNTYGYPYGYNATIGGNLFTKDTNPMNLQEIRDKDSAALKEYYKTHPDAIEKLREAARQRWSGEGNPMRKEETRKKVSERFKGKNNPACRPEVREKIRQAKLGKPASEEARRHMSENSGRPWLGKSLPRDMIEKRRATVKASGIFKRGNNPAAKTVIAVDSDNNVVYKFDSYADAVDYILSSDLLELVEACRKGRNKGLKNKSIVSFRLRQACDEGCLFCNLYWQKIAKCND